MFTSGTSQCEVPDFMLVLCLPQVLHSVKYLMLCSFYVYLRYFTVWSTWFYARSMSTSDTSQCEVHDVVLVLCLPQVLLCVKYLLERICQFWMLRGLCFFLFWGEVWRGGFIVLFVLSFSSRIRLNSPLLFCVSVPSTSHAVRFFIGAFCIHVQSIAFGRSSSRELCS